MSKHYTCDLCKKVFNQKIDFTRHQNKKAPCISLNEIVPVGRTIYFYTYSRKKSIYLF